MLAGVLVRTLASERGLMDAEHVANWMLPRSDHTPGTSLVCVEQTHNFHGGVVLPIDGALVVSLLRSRTQLAKLLYALFCAHRSSR